MADRPGPLMIVAIVAFVLGVVTRRLVGNVAPAWSVNPSPVLLTEEGGRVLSDWNKAARGGGR